MNRVIVLNGIGDANSGWSTRHKVARILGIPQENLIEFVYEDLMERNWLNKVLVWGARLAASYYINPQAGFEANLIQDYINDIVMYFFIPGIRKKILKRLSLVLKENPNAVVIGFSLGSVVAYETIKNYPGLGGKPVLVTMGSTLGSPPLEELVKGFLKVPNFGRPLVTDWFNIYSPEDKLSGFVDGLNCEEKDQFRIKATHKIEPYLKQCKAKLSYLFS